LRGIQRTFMQGDRQLEVLRGVSLDLRAGEIVALVGQSGSGKSTMLHIAGLLERPDAGDVVLDGKGAAALSDHQRTILRRKFLGFVYQYHHLLPEFSALENVMLPQMLNGLSRSEARRRAVDLLAMVQLKDRADHRPGRLLLVPWPMRRGCFWPTSRPAISMRRQQTPCSGSCLPWSARPAWRR
jgi:lipoprotein-releasing system ATP-binding protein